MTEMLNKEFSRTTFLKGGALVVGFSMVGAGVSAKVTKAAGIDPYASLGPYDKASLDSWITIHADNTASIKAGIIELGQGTSTGFLQIAGEELDMDMSQLRWVSQDTNVTPNQGSTSASRGIKNGGLELRAAAAQAKQVLLGMAATQLGVPSSNLTVSKGVVTGGGRSVSYGALLSDKLFNVGIPPPAASLRPGVAPSKPVSSYKLVGTRVPRLDIPDKVVGTFVYAHGIRVPGMLHGRVVLQRGQGMYGTADQVVSVDESSIKNIPGAQVVRRRNFVGVVAPTEYAAIQAAAQLKVTWADRPVLRGNGNLFAQMREQKGVSAPLTGQTTGALFNTGDVDGALASAAHVVSATYKWPFHGHVPIGPDVVVADVTPNGAVLYSGSQDLYSLRANLAGLLGLPADRIRIRYHESSSSYGSGAPKSTDVPEAAAVMSQIVGKPVRLQFMRWDEHGYDNHGFPMLIDTRAGVDANGKIVAFDYKAHAVATGGTISTMKQLLGSPFPAPPLATIETSVIGMQYTIPNWRAEIKSLPNLNSGYLKVGALRAMQAAAQGFGMQIFDELAYAAKMDPVAFHRLNVATIDRPLPDSGSTSTKSRWLAVLDAVAQAANWQPKVAASKLSNANLVTGRGIAFGSRGNSGSATLAAAVADIEVDKQTGKIVAKHIYTGQDYGLVIGPDLVTSQAMGQVMHATSRTLVEEVTFDKKGVTSLDWVSYPSLRFKDHPQHTHVVINRPAEGTGPSSEELLSPVHAALANAFFDATGVRIRQAPMTPGRVRATLAAAKAGTYK
jgi:CO/xanthine dehydrogenase Mo-binding subunit